MSKYQVYQYQSFLDLAIQLTGTVENSFWIAQVNKMNPSDELSPGVEIEIPEELITNREILKYFTINKITPATALTEQDQDTITGCEGIGCWAIGINFKVS